MSAGVPRRGFLEETRLAVEVAVTRVFTWARRLTRQLLLLPPAPGAPADDLSRAPSFNGWLPQLSKLSIREPASVPFNGKLPQGKPRLPTTQSLNTAEDLRHWTVSDVIIRVGWVWVYGCMDNATIITSLLRANTGDACSSLNEGWLPFRDPHRNHGGRLHSDHATNTKEKYVAGVSM